MQADPLPMHAVTTLTDYLAIGSSHQDGLTHPGSHSNGASCPDPAQTSHPGNGATYKIRRVACGLLAFAQHYLCVQL